MTDIELTAESFKVHASETVSTGDYESADFNVSIEGSVEGVHALENGTRKELKARLLGIQADLQDIVQRSAENRIAHPDNEDWGVRADE